MGSKLYVGNLNYNTSEEDIRSAFSAEGHQVMSVDIIKDRDTGRPKGFAFVEMASEQDAASVIDAWNNRELDGRPLRVNEAQDKPRRSFGGGGGGGGGGYGGGGGGYGGGGYGGGGGGRGGDRGGRGRF